MSKYCEYPEVKVDLIGSDGNAFVVLGKVRRALERHGIDPSEIERFTSEATSGDYDHLLRTVTKWVEII
jgi:hypothetical protein